MRIKTSIPKYWKWVQLGDICKILGGKPAPQELTAFCADGIPFVRMKDLGAYHLTTNLTTVTDCLTHNYVKQKRIVSVKKGAILMPRSGSVALNHRAILGMDAVIVSHICALEVDSPEVFNVYLYYLLTQIGMEKITKKTTGLDAITFQDLSELQIPLAPLPEQKRIAAILDNADAIRRKRQQAIKLADDFLRATFLDMFGDPVTNPKGWEMVPLRNFGSVTTGNTPSRKKTEFYGDNIEWIKSDNINTPSHFLTKAKEGLSKEGKKVARKVAPYSTLVTCIAGSFDCIGNSALSDREVAFNQQINAITPREDTDPFFIYCLILNAKRMIQNASTNSMKGMVSKGKFEQIVFFKPPTSLQQKFGSFFQSHIKKNNQIRTSERLSCDLFNSLTQRAFRGEL